MFGVGGGASGAAAGLLHPLSPRGKVSKSCYRPSLYYYGCNPSDFFEMDG